MTTRSGWAFWIGADLASAFSLLSRLPFFQTEDHRPASAWAWPVVGAAIGGLATLFGAGAVAVGVPLGVAAALILAVGAMTTGALHEDGLADSADGLFGGWTRERRLEIMKDSHIGSFGTLALLLVMLAAWSALVALLEAGAFGAIISSAVVSRAPMAVIMAQMAQARASGLSHTVGRPPLWAALGACGVAAIVAVALAGGLVAAAMIGAAALAGGAVALVARARIGGQTGDILGASQQLAHLAALAAATAVLP